MNSILIKPLFISLDLELCERHNEMSLEAILETQCFFPNQVHSAIIMSKVDTVFDFFLLNFPWNMWRSLLSYSNPFT